MRKLLELVKAPHAGHCCECAKTIYRGDWIQILPAENTLPTRALCESCAKGALKKKESNQ